MNLRLAAQDRIAAATAEVRARLGGFAPDTAMILGSGLGGLADALADAVAIPYDAVPGLPQPSVAGHAGRLVAGRLGRRRVLAFQGRVHAYESGDASGMAVALGLVARLGCRDLILTNAAGSLRAEVGPGSVAMIADHINLNPLNPLVGASGDGRFVDMVDAYDPGLRARFRAIAADRGFPLAEGVYMWFLGPSFETPAEIRAARALGADLVGMSTVPEVILARALGLKVAAFSLITNLAAGMGGAALSHAHTLAHAASGAAVLRDILTAFMEEDV